MTESALLAQQRTLLQEVTQLAAERAAEERRLTHEGKLRREQFAETAKKEQVQLVSRYEQQRNAINQEYTAAQTKLNSETETARREIEEGHDDAQEALHRQLQTERETLEAEYKEAKWTITTVYEAGRKNPKKMFSEIETQVGNLVDRGTTAQSDARKYLRDCGIEFDEATLVTPVPEQPIPEPMRVVHDCVQNCENLLRTIKGLSSPPLFRGPRLIPVYILVLGALVFPIGIATNWVPLFWIGGTLLATVAVSALVTFMLRSAAYNGSRELYKPLCQTMALLQAAQAQHIKNVGVLCEQQRLQQKQRRDQEMEEVEKRFAPRLAAFQQRVLAEQQQTDAGPLEAIGDLEARHRAYLEDLQGRFPQRLAELQKKHEQDLQRHIDQSVAARRDWESSHERQWKALAQRWKQGVAHIEAVTSQINQQAERNQPSWTADSWNNWEPPTDAPTVISFGKLQLTAADFPDAVPQAERLADVQLPPLSLPALTPFPSGAALLVRTPVAGREQSTACLQNLMLRLLVSLPAGKVRFTIIDPVGLGQNFAAFMNLADYNESLISKRIWTEPQQIEQKLADVTAHMENVIQKYLRNQFATIEDYNLQAGEIAEPYRFVVVANFPTNFTDVAARRLVSIAHSGARCGVYTIISADPKQSLPTGVTWKEFESRGIQLRWRDDRFVLQDPDFERFPLVIEAPPENARFSQLLQAVGERSKDANRVEVPFEFICPQQIEWWRGDSRKSVDVALGRSGATKRQTMRLGLGTSQHVLIAGKTGSGKSTLLHAMITNLALLYSPQEIELYLIDFKKGVEFKTYATYRLPHARVVAIESEREFGLSVMQRLDAELKERGERFRSLGVQDVNGFRAACPDEPLPRILLIVDEFQEFFTEDDKIAQEVTLLLDRLVRQGRAFGIHILFGSQTLGGSFTLPRSTIGQMAVRIALQCSETDAHLILSEENSAARLLTRPGEAIYNDANGLVEGNNPFQVTWLTEEKREFYLQQVLKLARERLPQFDRPQIVFEGNVPAQLPNNRKLMRYVTQQDPPPRVPELWLGEAIAIKDPTVASFRRQSGSHLMLIGQQDESATALLSAAIVSLAAQLAEVEGARIYVADGTPTDSPRAGILTRIAGFFAPQVQVVDRRNLPTVLAEMATEVERRLAANEAEAPAQFVLINDLARFRDLRKQEDDYSFSRGDKAPSADKLLNTILREGPGVGIHVICWCDTWTNVQRTLERSAQREFEMRVLFQMSVNDSSQLIDAPAASKLGPYRALLHEEEHGRLEKFRPYGLPSDEWLQQVASDLVKNQGVTEAG